MGFKNEHVHGKKDVEQLAHCHLPRSWGFTVIPDLWYFAKVVAISSVLVVFSPVYRTRLIWRIDATVVLAGVAIGVVWIAFGLPNDSRTLALNTVHDLDLLMNVLESHRAFFLKKDRLAAEVLVLT